MSLMRYLAQVHPAGALNQASHEIWACCLALLSQRLVCEFLACDFQATVVASMSHVDLDSKGGI